MTTTATISLTPEWVEVASGSANVLVQRRTIGAVFVFVGAAVPAVGSTVGVSLAGNATTFACSDLVAVDKVFARALEVSEITVVKN